MSHYAWFLNPDFPHQTLAMTDSTTALPQLLRCAAPAKINLFLHVVGRRADGYHLLQSVFQLIDLCDWLDFQVLPSEDVIHQNPLPNVPAETDLCVRAARLLQAHVRQQGQSPQGVAIRIEKHIPMGGGLGGGSSDAATTLLALNYLWKIGLSRSDLMTLGLQLGSDVPFFLFGSNAFVEGIGERMQAVQTRKSAFVIIAPGVHVPTPLIFSAKDLTRDSDHVMIADFSSSELSEKESEFGKNDLQAVAENLFPPIKQAVSALSKFGDARMTGSGSCVFCRVSSDIEANVILQQISGQWTAFQASALELHPFAQLLEKKRNF